VPMTRIASGAEMAQIACRLLGDEFRFMTGHALVVDGGELLL
jgi:NAD(P)-dependent dehydrogenase (short-subunit alcohol dehydrogenase family)